MKKFVLLILIGLLISLPFVFAFEWPQSLKFENLFSSFFGQSRGSTFSNSLVFENPAEVMAAEDGTLLITLGSGISDMGWYESTLGNAVILSHPNNVLTVYGNLEEVSIVEDSSKVSKNEKIGVSGTSGWSNGKNSLEFQVIDTKSNNVINPFILMPVLTSGNSLEIKGLMAISSSGNSVNITNYSKISSGTNKLYINKQSKGMVYKTTVSVNGAVVETITYDVLSSKDGRLAVQGKRAYTYDQVYPSENQQLLAEVVFSKGKNLLSIVVEDFSGNQKTINYTIEAI